MSSSDFVYLIALQLLDAPSQKPLEWDKGGRSVHRAWAAALMKQHKGKVKNGK